MMGFCIALYGSVLLTCVFCYILFRMYHAEETRSSAFGRSLVSNLEPWMQDILREHLETDKSFEEICGSVDAKDLKVMESLGILERLLVLDPDNKRLVPSLQIHPRWRDILVEHLDYNNFLQ